MEEDESREEWTRSDIMKLIEAYKSQDCLWNANNMSYRDKRKRNAAWKQISIALNKDIFTVERKMKVLKTQFMHCYKVFKKYSSRGDPYQPKWFAYRSLKFLIPGKIIRENREMYRLNKNGFQEVKAEPIAVSDIVYQEQDPVFNEFSESREQRAQSESHIVINKPAFQDVSCSKSEQRQLLQKEPETYTTYGSRDEFSIFGELIACRLRKIKNPRTRLKVQFNITNALFEAQMQEVEQENGYQSFGDDNTDIA